MAEAFTDDSKLAENHSSLMSERPPDYPESSIMTSESPTEADTMNPGVPGVEIRDQRLYNQAPPTSPSYTPEQMQQITEKMKQEESKKYFSLRVRKKAFIVLLYS